jgi:iron complex transport system substrate-binding protein
LTAAEDALRAATARCTVPMRVLAVSVAGPDQVYVARPQTWPELRHLATLGVRLIDPAGDTGANWAARTAWTQALAITGELGLPDTDPLRAKILRYLHRRIPDL